MESYEIAQPLPFRDMNYYMGKRCQKIFLYRSKEDEVFWFSKSNDVVYLFILENTNHRPTMYKIGNDSKLH